MTKADELNALADRCEREEGSVELDAAIHVALYAIKGTSWVAGAPPWSHYTTSLDAAVTLKPTGWRFRNMDEGEPSSRHLQPCAEIIPLYGDDAIWAAFEKACVPRGRIMGFGKTLTLALCAAALRARAAISHPEPAPMRSERSERATPNQDTLNE